MVKNIGCVVILLRNSRVISVKSEGVGNVLLILIAFVPDVVMTPKFDLTVEGLDSTVLIFICNGILPAALPAILT